MYPRHVTLPLVRVCKFNGTIVSPCAPHPSARSTKRSRSNFHPVRNFYFSTNETTKGEGGQSLTRRPEGEYREGCSGGGPLWGGKRHSPFGTRSTVGGQCRSKTIDTITRNRHRRWEDDASRVVTRVPLFYRRPTLPEFSSP